MRKNYRSDINEKFTEEDNKMIGTVLLEKISNSHRTATLSNEF